MRHSFAMKFHHIFLVLIVGLFGSSLFSIAHLKAQANKRTKNPVYTVSNFEVWAEAKDAVAAKRAALSDGRSVALSLLLKRLTLFSSYDHLPKLDDKALSKIITSLSVQNEKNSTTEYLATMDFKFSAKGVKTLLRKNQIPFWDRQAKEVLIIPVVDAGLLEVPAGKTKPIMSQAEWISSWNTLDLAHALVPLKVGERLALIDDAVLSALIRGEKTAKEGLRKAYQGKPVVVALLSAAQSKSKLRLSLVGFDGVGEITYKSDHLMPEGSAIGAADIAAEVALGLFEQRVKLLRIKPQLVRRSPVEVEKQEVLPWQTKTQEDAPIAGWQGDVGGARIVMHVKFSGLRHWQAIRKRLLNIDGVEELNIEKLSARGADVSCLFPGGAEALAQQVAAVGMNLQPNGEKWVLLAN